MKIDLQKLFNSRLFTMAISLLIAIVAWVVVVTTISTEGESVIKGVPVIPTRQNIRCSAGI